MNAHGLFTLGTVLCWSMVVETARGQELTFPVLPEHTLVGLTVGKVTGLSFDAQSSGSLMTRASGDVMAESLGGDAIRLSTGNSFIAQTLAMPQSPGIGGGAGVAPANFGMTLNVPFGTGRAAIRDLVFDFAGDYVPGSDTSTLTAKNTSGRLDYDIQSAVLSRSGSVSLVDADVVDSSSAAVSVPTGSGTFRLDLSSGMTLHFSTLSPNDSELRLFIGISTEGIVPEPASLGLALPAMQLTLRWRRTASPLQ